jgi:hypothetical protein
MVSQDPIPGAWGSRIAQPSSQNSIQLIGGGQLFEERVGLAAAIFAPAHFLSYSCVSRPPQCVAPLSISPQRARDCRDRFIRRKRLRPTPAAP